MELRTDAVGKFALNKTYKGTYSTHPNLDERVDGEGSDYA